MTLLDDFCELFEGNKTAVGLETGGCLRVPADPTADSWWRDMLRLHLDGVPTGVYPMTQLGPTWRVRWGCIDYDEGDRESLIHARNTVKILGRFNITGWIERSRSKGYHVWVFAHTWVAASTMRRALLATAQLVDAPMREINPKQAILSPGQLGNYVRLPYPGGDKAAVGDGRRQVLYGVDSDGWQNYWACSPWVRAALDARTNTVDLEKLAELYRAPEPIPRYKIDPERLTQPPRERMSPLAKHMLDNGQMQGQDRSSYLWKLANILFEHCELTDKEILETLTYAHETHTPDKFAGRMHMLEKLMNDVKERYV